MYSSIVLVELRTADELAPFRDRAHLPFFDDDLAALENVARIGEQHAVLVRLLRVDGDVAVGADARAAPSASDPARAPDRPR